MRTLQSQVGWCVRMQWTLAASLVALCVGFLVFGYRPANAKLQGLQMQIQSKQRELGANQSRAKNLPIVALEVEKLQERLKRFDKKLPKQQELGNFIREITHLSDQSALRKLMVQPGIPRRSDLYSEMPIWLNFEGDFLSVFSFLRQTEEMQRLTRFKSIGIKTKNARGGQVEVQLSMNIYFSEG